MGGQLGCTLPQGHDGPHEELARKRVEEDVRLAEQRKRLALGL